MHRHRESARARERERERERERGVLATGIVDKSKWMYCNYICYIWTSEWWGCSFLSDSSREIQGSLSSLDPLGTWPKGYITQAFPKLKALFFIIYIFMFLFWYFMTLFNLVEGKACVCGPLSPLSYNITPSLSPTPHTFTQSSSLLNEIWNLNLILSVCWKIHFVLTLRPNWMFCSAWGMGWMGWGWGGGGREKLGEGQVEKKNCSW